MSGASFPCLKCGRSPKNSVHINKGLFLYHEWIGTPQNARLIAAAPELLQACQEARDVLAYHWRKSAEDAFANRQAALPWPVIQHLESAIAKAGGAA